MNETITVPAELWKSITLVLQEAQTDLNDASSVVDKSDDEDYAYQNTLEMLRSVNAEVATFEAPSRGGQATDADSKGWFDVDAYSTRELWEGPDAADNGLDGFNTLEAAIEHANSDSYKDCYQVTVVALGQHTEHDPGARVYHRFNRPDTP